MKYNGIMRDNVLQDREGHHDITLWEMLGILAVVLLIVPACLLAIWGIYEQGTEGMMPYYMLAVIGVALLFWLARYVESHPAAGAIVVFVTALLARLLFLVVWPIEPVDDFALSYHLAEKLASGDAQTIHAAIQDPYNLYATTWSVHMPFVLTEAGLLRLFGGGVRTLQICFAVCSACTCLLTERVTGALTNTRTGWIAGMMMAVNPTALYFAPVLSNQHAALTFCLLAVWFFYARPLRHDWSNALAAGAALAVSNLLRPEMLVVLVAFVCYAVYRAFCRKGLRQKGKALARSAVEIAIVAALLLGSTSVVSAVLSHAGLIREPMTQSHTYYKLAVGLNVQSIGKWNAEDAEIENDEEALEARVRERLSQPVTVLRLMVQKTKYQFGFWDYSWSGREDAAPRWQDARHGICQSWMFLVFLLVIVSAVAMVYLKRAPLLPFLVIVLGYFMVFALIEVQDRYNYLLLPFLTAAAVWFPADCLGRWKKKKMHRCTAKK